MTATYSVAFAKQLIRTLFALPKTRQVCAVCGRYKTVSHAHHTVPVAEMARLCVERNLPPAEFERLPVRIMWLCPTHHALFHAINGASGQHVQAIIDDVGADEYEALSVIFDARANGYSDLTKFLLSASPKDEM